MCLGVHPLLEVREPGPEPVGPCLDGELVESVVGKRKVALEAIVHVVSKSGFRELLFSLLAPFDDSTKKAVPVAKDVGLDVARFARDPLGGVSTTVDAGGNRFDEDMPVHQVTHVRTR